MFYSETAATIIAFLVIIILFLLFVKQTMEKDDTGGKEYRYAGLWWFLTFAGGIVLYFTAYISVPMTDDQTAFVYYSSAIIRGLESSLQMFIFTFNYGSVQGIVETDQLEGYVFFILMSIIFISACLWSIIMAKNVFFKGAANNVTLWHNRNILLPRKKSRYIIIGTGRSARTFLLNLEKTKEKKFIIIITGESKDVTESLAHYRAFLNDGYPVINGEANKNALIKAGINNRKMKTIVVAATEDDAQNVAVAYIVKEKVLNIKDSMTKAENKKKKYSSDESKVSKIGLEAHVMYSFIERTEYFSFAESAFGKIDFFNPYELRARAFFDEHPVTRFIPDLIDTNKARLKGDYRDGRVYKPKSSEREKEQQYNIKNVFVGFGHTNSQMLKYSLLTCQLLGCDYNAVIFDENKIDNRPSVREAMFINNSPGLFEGGDESIPEDQRKKLKITYYESPTEKYNIVFKPGNVLTKKFYDDIIKEVEGSDLTQIYVSLGDDRADIETACEIRQCLLERYFFERSHCLDKLRLFVKIREKSTLSDDAVLNDPHNIIIECFGEDKEILTVDNVIGESLDGLAQTISNKHHGIAWGELSETKRDSNRQVALTVRMKLNLLGFNITNNKESSDALRITESEYETAYGLSDEIKAIIEKRKNVDSKDFCPDGYVTKCNREISDIPRNNLARLEHVRWNTFQLAQGWTKKPLFKIGAENDDRPGTDDTGRQNKTVKEHACITTFESLVLLRELQAKALMKATPQKGLTLEEAMREVDVICYDFDTMDELLINLPKQKEGSSDLSPPFQIIRLIKVFLSFYSNHEETNARDMITADIVKRYLECDVRSCFSCIKLPPVTSGTEMMTKQIHSALKEGIVIRIISEKELQQQDIEINEILKQGAKILPIVVKWKDEGPTSDKPLYKQYCSIENGANPTMDEMKKISDALFLLQPPKVL